MFKLRNVSLIMFACAAILPLAAFWYWTAQATAISTSNNVEEKHLVQARLLKASLAKYHNDFSEALVAELSENDVMGDHTISGLQKGFGLRTICAVGPDYRLETIASAFGFSCPPFIEDISTRSHIDKAKNYVVHFLPVVKAKDGQSQMPVVTRIGDRALYITVSTQIFTHLGSSVAFGDSAHALITDQSGGLLYHPDPDVLTSQATFRPFEQQDRLARIERDGVIEYLDEKGQGMIAGYALVDSPRWVVYITQPYEAVTALARANRNAAVLIAIACLAIVLLGVIIFVSDLSRPIEQVIDVANDIDHEGDLRQVPVSQSWRTPQEVRALQIHFNAMVEKLSISVGKVKRIAYTDLVTDGLNRQAFTRKTDIALDAAVKNEVSMVYLYVDLDDFKGVNDTYGHEAGDIYLRTIYMRMTRSLIKLVKEHTTIEKLESDIQKELLQDDGQTPIVSRIGGDEFAAFFPFKGPDSLLVAALEEFQASISSPIRLGSEKVGVGTSIGAARMPQKGVAQAELSKDADGAMYAAKKGGKNRVVVFESSLDILTNEITYEDVQAGFDNEEFVLVYQPRLRLFDCTVMGAEASLHWQHPQLGRIGADIYMPSIVGTDMVVKLGEWLLLSLCRDMRASDLLQSCKVMAVRVPSRLLMNKDFIQNFERVIDEHGLNKNQFELEISGEDSSRQSSSMNKNMHALRNAGFALAVKDFGKTASNILEFGAIDIQTLVIDRSLVSRITKNFRDKIIVESLINMAHKLGVQTIVDGIETDGELRVVHGIGCQGLQGKLFAAPMVLTDLETWMSAQSTQSINASLSPKGNDIMILEEARQAG